VLYLYYTNRDSHRLTVSSDWMGDILSPFYIIWAKWEPYLKNCMYFEILIPVCSACSCWKLAWNHTTVEERDKTALKYWAVIWRQRQWQWSLNNGVRIYQLVKKSAELCNSNFLHLRAYFIFLFFISVFKNKNIFKITIWMQSNTLLIYLLPCSL